MPNHVHVVFHTLNETPMHQVLNGWKGASSRKINQLLGISGKLWQRESYDRFVRDEDHYYACRRYIRGNPVKAKLCEKPEDWKFSSATERCLQAASLPNNPRTPPKGSAPSHTRKH